MPFLFVDNNILCGFFSKYSTFDHTDVPAASDPFKGACSSIMFCSNIRTSDLNVPADLVKCSTVANFTNSAFC